jgi:glucose-6-phosphate 1-epimerase
MPSNIAEQMQQLYSQYGELPGVHIELHKELLAVRIENQAAVATIFLQGAQLSNYTLKEQEELIWCSDSSDYRDGQPLRGGIPICWPWFGDLERNPSAVQKMASDDSPPHGFARLLPWRLSDIQLVDSQRTDVTFTLETSESEQYAAAFDCSLELVVSVGLALTVKLTVKNSSNKTINFATALHSYFSVGNIENVTINGLEDLDYTDCVNNWSIETQHGALIIDKETDRIYQGSNSEINIVDQDRKRVIRMTSDGSNSTVIWNPWIEKSKHLSNFDDEDYRSMLCIETANVGNDSIQLKPGANHCLSLKVECSPVS